MEKTLLGGLIVLTLGLLLAAPLRAQPDSRFDDIPLNGLAAFEQLRKEYYVGALYLESLRQETGAIMASTTRKRMDIRITIDEWSPRRFGQQWTQSILINNTQEQMEQFAEEIQAFANMPEGDLVAGDRITVDLSPENGTTVYLNNQRMFNVQGEGFFNLLLNTWIGQRPPSSEFKSNILTLPTDQTGTNLLVRYESSTPSPAREKLAATWASDDADEQTAAAGASASQEETLRLPDDDNTVTARRTDTESPRSAAPVAAAAPAAIAAPRMEVEKPRLSSSSESQSEPEPEPAPEPEPEPKPEPQPEPKPKPAAKPEPEKTASTSEPSETSQKQDEQDRLLRAYTSNALKLTYLNTQYPRRAMEFKQEGLVVLKVTINRQGEVNDIEVETSSEHNLLNRAARKAVSTTEPFPEVPKGLEGNEIVLTMPFQFRL